MKETPQISIIIPVYNVESYLCRCLDSILIQSYKGWECILVDDGSTDGSSKICDDYVEKDDRFKVIHKENGGVSSARNIGIRESKGDWMFFADADDILEKDALQTLMIGVEKGCKLVMAGFNVYTETGQLKETAKKQKDKIITTDEAICELYLPSDFSYQGYLWSKLFNSKYVKDKNLRFNESISFNEDGLFILQYICKVKGYIYYTTKPVYNYCERGKSAMGSMNGHFNPAFSTHFDSVILQKKVVFAYTKKLKLRFLSLRRIATLYMYCHDLMYKCDDCNSAIHKKMLKKLISSGAIFVYLIICISRPFLLWLKLVSWVLCPSVIISIKKKR